MFKSIFTIIITLISVSIQSAHSQTIIEKKIEKEVSVNEKDGVRKIVIIEKSSDGTEKVIEWEGSVDDEMPAEVAQAMEDVTIVTDEKRKEKRVMKFFDEDGNEQTLEWNGEGDMPAKMKEEMRRHGMHPTMPHGEMRKEIREKWENASEEERTKMKEEIKMQWKEKWENASDEEKAKMKEHREEMFIEREIERGPRGMQKHHGMMHQDGKKPRLGIEIQESAAGVVIDNVLKGSPAEKAGLQTGDIIYQVDDTEVDSLDKLLSELGTHDINESVKVKYLRQGKKKTAKVTLQ